MQEHHILPHESVERLIAGISNQTHSQVMAILKAIDQRISANIADMEARFTSSDLLNQTRINGLRELCITQLDATRGHSAERLGSLRDMLVAKIEETGSCLERRVADWLEARDKALVLQAAEYERRLGLLNHQREILNDIGSVYVRADIYRKDMERIYTERKEQQAIAENVRVTQEIAATNARRTTALTLLSVMASVLLSLALHFIPTRL